MKKLKWMPVFCAVLLFLSVFLTGCGGSAKSKEAYDMAEPAEAPEAYYYSMSDSGYGGLNYADGYMEAKEEDAPTATVGEESLPDAAQQTLKMVYTVDLTVETLDYDKSMETVDSLTAQFGGYIEYAQTENNHINSQYLRGASYTLRIPADRLDAFLESCGEVGNVCSSTKRSENRTTEYTDLSARLSTLKIEEKSLQELLEQAEDLDTVVALHSYLSDVRYEIERTESRMRGIDGLVSYSTVNLYLEEVRIASDPITPKSSFGERVSARLHNSWNDFTRGMENFGVFVLGELPLFLLRLILVLLPFAIIIFVIILLIRRGRRKREAKRALKAQNREEMPTAPQTPENKQE